MQRVLNMNGIFFKRSQTNLLLQVTDFIKSMFLLEGTARTEKSVWSIMYLESLAEGMRDEAAEIS